MRVPVRGRTGAIAEAVRRLDAAGVGHRRHRAAPPDARRRLHLAHRPRRRGSRRGRGGGAHELSRTTVSDTLVLARRNLKRIPRQPDLLIAYTVQPVMFVLLFVYVFGGAIQTPGFDYVDFLMPGIIVQSIAFGGFVTALGLSEDVQKGLIDRFRSLPMSRAAVLTGRTLSDVLLNCLSLDRAARRRADLRLQLPEHDRGEVVARDLPAAAVRLRVLVDLRAGRAVLVARRRRRTRSASRRSSR